MPQTNYIIVKTSIQYSSVQCISSYMLRGFIKQNCVFIGGMMPNQGMNPNNMPNPQQQNGGTSNNPSGQPMNSQQGPQGAMFNGGQPSGQMPNQQGSMGTQQGNIGTQQGTSQQGNMPGQPMMAPAPQQMMNGQQIQRMPPPTAYRRPSGGPGN